MKSIENLERRGIHLENSDLALKFNFYDTFVGGG